MIVTRQYILFAHIVVALLLHSSLAKAQGLIIPVGSYVIQQGGNFIMGHNFTNNGSFTQNEGTVVFSGSTQSLGGTSATSFKNLSISSGSTTSVVTSGHTLSDVLLSDGTLNGNSNFTLLSTASQTALVDGASTGDVLGINMQRYLASGFGYKYFSSPFQAATVNEFSNEVDLEGDFPPVYRYEENHNSTGWFFHINPASPLVPVQGYAVNFGSSLSPITADMTGDANNGPLSINIYNNNQTYTQGFNLVGNPYPSPIDWDAATGWTRTNIDNAVYYFDAGNSDEYGGTYSSYINGISSDGIANNIIPSMQGFFVHVSDGTYPVTGELGTTNAVRVNNLSPVFHKLPGKENPLLRLHAKFTNSEVSSDPAVIYFDNDAAIGFDVHMDALKMMNTDKRVPNVYIAAPGANKLSISAMPQPADSISIVPLGIETYMDGELTFSISDVDHMPYGLNIYFADSRTREITDAVPGMKYKVYLQNGKEDKRFSVIFSKKPLPKDLFTKKELNAYTANGKIYVYLNLNTGDKGDLAIVNTLGQVVGKYELKGFGYHEINANFSTGIYIASFYSSEGVYSKKLLIANN